MKDLRGYLLTNSIFSGISGLLIVIFNQSFLMNYLGIKNAMVLYLIGIGLVLFSVFIYYVIKKRLDDDKTIFVISVLDTIWVLGSFSITIFDLFNINPKSFPLINFVALWVGLLASGQFYFLRKRNRK